MLGYVEMQAVVGTETDVNNLLVISRKFPNIVFDGMQNLKFVCPIISESGASLPIVNYASFI